MHEAEFDEFGALLSATAAYYDRKLVPDTIAIYWRGLADLELDQVRAALNAHAQDPQAGQFMPKIADIRRQIEAGRDDGHPGPDEAWSIAIGARHEGATVVWTDQIAGAFFQVALPLLDEGDKIAARKAFLERYERDIAEARRAGVVARWQASFGGDPEQRRQAIEQAAQLGRLTQEQVARLLPPAAPAAPNLQAIEASAAKALPAADARREIARLRSMLRLG